MNASTKRQTKMSAISSEDYWSKKLHLSTLTNGLLPAVGSQAPDFSLTNNELKDVTLKTYAGSRKVLAILPSFDVPMCAAFVRKLNQKKANIDNTVILIVSADLPFAQRAFFESERLHNVVMVSTFRSSFPIDYGVQIINGELAGLMAPSAIVLDEQNNVIYTQTTTELTKELDDKAIISALNPPVIISSSTSTLPSNRRESFRITPLTTSCYCNIPLSMPKHNATEEYKHAYSQAVSKIHEKWKSQQQNVAASIDNKLANVMQLNLRDISSTGCSLFNYDEAFSYFLTPNTIYKNCIIHMPDNAKIKVSCKIVLKKRVEHNIEGKFSEIVAVEFINMTQAIESTVSYYVREIERQRISLIFDNETLTEA